MKSLSVLLASLLAAGVDPGFDQDFDSSGKMYTIPTEPKNDNKYNLTAEEKEFMKDLGPKEKKRFLKERSRAKA